MDIFDFNEEKKLCEGGLEHANFDTVNRNSTTRPLGNCNIYCGSMYLFTKLKNLGTNNILYYETITLNMSSQCTFEIDFWTS